jgi:farnesyl-diphosphate farnesyltransferase
MVLKALPQGKECLFYLAGLKEQSVFNFAATLQAMAIATLGLVFRNHAIFRHNIKMTRGQACRITVD